jgi:enamine deaminase RidA (YjgF/YER057c/UK114 family)
MSAARPPRGATPAHGAAGPPSTIEARLASLGLVLPAPLVLPSANRTSAVLIGELLYVSGHGAQLLGDDASVPKRGKVGRELTEEQGYAVARALALKMLATVRHHLGDLDRVRRVVKIVGMVNAVPEYERHNMVVNGASDLLFEVFGPEIGCHARSSLGVSGLVGDQPVEIEGIFHVAPAPARA